MWIPRFVRRAVAVVLLFFLDRHGGGHLPRFASPSLSTLGQCLRVRDPLAGPISCVGRGLDRLLACGREELRWI
jgi:hypothetical protein